MDLRDRFETSDGSRPELSPLTAELAKGLALNAFTVLAGGDVMDISGAPPKEGAARARQYLTERIQLRENGAPVTQRDRVEQDLVKQLQGSLLLIGRLQRAKPIVIDLVPAKRGIAAFGFPKAVARSAAGVFWDKPAWEQARIALRQDRIEQDSALVFHEMAHAIHYLGFTKQEQKQLYDVLGPTFGSRAAMDEVFAIYSERELGGAFGEQDKKAPGVYGYTRRQWNEDHLFTRFVRKLYFPYKPAAGPQMAPRGGGDWMKGIARR